MSPLPSPSPDDAHQNDADTADVSRTANPATFQCVFQSVEQVWPPHRWQTVTVVVAVSGGADSVALLRILDRLKRGVPSPGRLVIAHFDHGWREQSADDARFVHALSVSLGWECVIGKTSDPTNHQASTGGKEAVSAPPKSSSATESGARDERYAFLESVAADVGARYIVTAHTADDQAETIMHRILRGTGWRGLAGIPVFRMVNESLTIARPLLRVSRDDVIKLLVDLDQPFRTDDSNQDTRFTRNRIRHSLLPQLREEYNPAVEAALLRLGQLASEVQSELDASVAPLLEEHCDFSVADQVSIDLTMISENAISKLIRREFIRQVWQRMDWPQQSMGFSEWEWLERQMRSAGQEKNKMLPGNVTADQSDGQLVLRRSTNPL